MATNRAARLEKVIAFNGLDHQCWGEASVDEALRDPDTFCANC